MPPWSLPASEEGSVCGDDDWPPRRSNRELNHETPVLLSLINMRLFSRLMRSLLALGNWNLPAGRIEVVNKCLNREKMSFWKMNSPLSMMGQGKFSMT